MTYTHDRFDALTLVDGMLRWATSTHPSSARGIKARAAMMFPGSRREIRFAKFTRLIACRIVDRRDGRGGVLYSKAPAYADDISHDNPCLVEITDIDVDKLLIDIENLK